MDIEGISGAAMVALTSTIVFVLIAKSWQLINRSVGSTPSFSHSIMREAAQRFRDEFERLSSSQSTYLGAGVMFTVLFVAAYMLQAGQLFAGYPVWQLHVLLAVLGIGAVMALCRLARTVVIRHRVKLCRDANIAIGHQLQRIAAGAGRAYHDVETSAGVIDHLFVSQRGAYAVSVFARPPQNNGSVSLDGTTLRFEPSGEAETIVATSEKIASLERDFRRLLDHRVRVRSVIAIPGWEIGEQGSEDYLLVNERNLAMLSGWNDKVDHLMNDDVNALHELLTARCSLGEN